MSESAPKENVPMDDVIARRDLLTGSAGLGLFSLAAAAPREAGWPRQPPVKIQVVVEEGR
jgi:hypothetical protein